MLSISRAQAQQLDQEDSLKNFRQEFHIPQKDGKDCIYFCGNSLGLQPKQTQHYIQRELDTWQAEAVEGHFRGERPWMYYHKLFKKSLAQLVGAKEEEVVAMNNLTSNLHFLLVSFYRPTSTRFKILMDGGAFPSDQYAIESQVKFHAASGGFDWKGAIVEVFPREGETYLRTEDILATIEKHKEQLALVMMGGVQYYTGQFFDLKAITEKAHAVGALAGFDLAHAIGNLPMQLHDWDVDFATWCSYKYLNSGPGGISGIFVHEKYALDPKLPRFAGWWGYEEAKRFKMQKGFIPMYGADGWQHSNVNILSAAAHLASLEIFDRAGIQQLRKKSVQLTAFAEKLVMEVAGRYPQLQHISPREPEARGAQLSLVVKAYGKLVFDYLSEQGVIADWREPEVIRIAPIPLYNTFEEVFDFALLLEYGLKKFA
ncbi:kynureninase [Cytophagales bacterium LB-30]|uniref:Kynureninase n=1 Tax=Shiella aurantiaca TaxID=3058365 RepID=A0ABT8F569_9BACT|nr:kynureninase [Shiella aurantiaca]MDN4165613.1 kynureninase [Shiella aurantiaca]